MYARKSKSVSWNIDNRDINQSYISDKKQINPTSDYGKGKLNWAFDSITTRDKKVMGHI